jgi:hypothetical protein
VRERNKADVCPKAVYLIRCCLGRLTRSSCIIILHWFNHMCMLHALIIPWELIKPYQRVSRRRTIEGVNCAIQELTSIEILLHRDRDLAQVLDLRSDGREQRAVAQITRVVHGSLKRVSLPSKDIVSVLAIPGAICVSALAIISSTIPSGR